MKIWVNGTNVLTEAIDPSAPQPNTTLYVGSQTNNTSHLDGKLAELGLWTGITLTDGEVLSLSKGISVHQIRPQSLSFYAPLLRNLQDIRGGRTITNFGAAATTHHRIFQ